MIEDEYKSILKQIEDQKNFKNKVEAEKQKAFRELEALEKQEEELLVEEKRNDLKEVITKRNRLANEEEQLEREIRAYQEKKKQWEKSEVKKRELNDQPYEHGVKAGKITFEREMLEERKHGIELEINAKRREKEKLERSLLQMSSVDNFVPPSKSTVSRLPHKIEYKPSIIENKSEIVPEYDYSGMNNSRPSTQTSKISSYLGAISLENEKILKFKLSKEGKSEEDKMIETIMAQEYDDLLILSKLPKGSELYNAKMKQYVELSKHRMEAQEKAQKQRVEKMKRQFEFEKIMNTKEQNNTKWVNENRKDFMLKQMEVLKENGEEQKGSKQVIMMGSKDGQKGSRFGTDPDSKSYPYNDGLRDRKSKNKDPFGFRISILSLRNYSLKKAIKIKVILYEEFYNEEDMGLKYEFGTVYHDEGISSQVDPYNPNYKNKLDSTGAIAYNETFYVSENLQEVYSKNQKEIFLLLIAAEKDEKRVTNEPKPYCWYSFKITHFGQIKEGRFTVNLYGDDIVYPHPADMNKMKKKKQEEITFEIEEIFLDQHLQQHIKDEKEMQSNAIKIDSRNGVNSFKNDSKSGSFNNSRNTLQQNPRINSNQSITTPMNVSNNLMKNANGSKVNMDYPIKMKIVEENEAIQVNSSYFFSNEKPTEFSHVQLKKPLNFDVSVAGLRTLPSYIGPIKLEMSFIDADSAHVVEREEFLASVSTDLYNPLINYTRQIRNETRIPPSTIVLIRMIGISALDFQVYCLGFSLLYLFLDSQGNPIKSNKMQDYLMTSGYYQLPIFWGNIDPKYIDIEDLLTNYPPIPCASLLIGILENASKISNPMPKYSDKVYNTILFQIDETESKLFKEQYKREPIDTNTLISGYLHYKGIKKNYSGEEIEKYLFKTLTFSSENLKSLFELKWMAEYQEYFGINFVIDTLNIENDDGKFYYYYATICFCPPANYYKEKQFDLNFMKDINMQVSTTKEIKFDDNEFYFNPSYYKNGSIIVEINRVEIFEKANQQNGDNIEGYGYVIIPIFEMVENIRSVNVTQTTFPLWKGDFDNNEVEALEKNLKGYLERKAKLKKSQSSISCRLLNGYFLNQYPPIYPDPENAKMYKDIVPANMSFEEALEGVSSVLSNNYNIKIELE